MSSYDVIPDLSRSPRSSVLQCQASTSPVARRKSRLSVIDTDGFPPSIITASSSTKNVHSDPLTSSFRRRSTIIPSSRIVDPFREVQPDKDNRTNLDESSEDEKEAKIRETAPTDAHENRTEGSTGSTLTIIVDFLGQLPAVALIGIFHLMVGIPFGVSYFPMYWASHLGDGASGIDGGPGSDGDSIFHEEGRFPIQGKEALGIRMFLFSTFVAQVAFTFFSGFKNPIGLQMVENIGFTKELAAVAISHQGYGLEALSTVMVMFSIASLLVGIVFFLLGKFQMGKIVYFFPTHVLIGLIGGIGILLCKTGLENTLADTVSIETMLGGWNHWIIVVALELFLRLLEYATTDSKGNPQFILLSPIFFCMITPIFYLALSILKISISDCKDAGYFFPSLNDTGQDEQSGTSFEKYSGTPWDLWMVCKNCVELRLVEFFLLRGYQC